MRAFSIVFFAAAALDLGTIIWAAFDLHHRIAYTQLAQIPLLVCWVISKSRRKRL
jgi:hypothetical protein